MLETAIMALTIEPRSKQAPKVQEILTKYGCIIKTRLGMHETTETDCSQMGLIILHLCANNTDIELFQKDLNSIDGVKVNYMII